MFIIADSGSTKTEWAFVTESEVKTAVTAGINPVHMTAGEIASLLREHLFPVPENVRAIRFYGAGCIPSKCGEVAEVLRGFFGTADVSVESDLAGAARGLFGRNAGVACILGTGSNSALYDGRTIVENIPPLGYVLGDEGSGADLGKRLLNSVLKKRLPKQTINAFYAEYPLEYAEIIGSVYRQSGANRFLAQFCPFLCRHIERPEIRAIVEAAFTDFVERNLLGYEGIRSLPVSFVGSVAHYFEEPLTEVLAAHGLLLGKIERSPLEGLVRHHRDSNL